MKTAVFPAVSRLDFGQDCSFSPSRDFCNGLLVHTVQARDAAHELPGMTIEGSSVALPLQDAIWNYRNFWRCEPMISAACGEKLE
ncbi:MAG: hypothetical protein HYV27_13935 [Candidatus Hydrogenedentes bacterium]|nr:hypothetical protein [Candidatus Hydrogenedentota bacterium]